MTAREKSVIIGILLVFAFGLLFFTLSRYRFYQSYIDIGGSSIEYGPVGTVASSADDTADTERLVDINRAGIEELIKLPGIGRVTALSIIDYRTLHGPFSDINELIKVRGIGEKKLEMLKECVTIR
jgi:competence protein ComEA